MQDLFLINTNIHIREDMVEWEDQVVEENG